MKKTVIASVDRIEGDSIVCISDENSEEIILKKSDFPLICERDIVEITLENELPVSVKKDKTETEKRIEANSQRLNNLFNRNK